MRIPRQEPRAGHGREGRGDEGFGVVGQAVLLVGVGPAVVEDEFAVGMVFEVERAGGLQRITEPEGDEMGCPTRLRTRTFALMHGCQILVPQEGAGVALLGEQGVPRGGIDL